MRSKISFFNRTVLQKDLTRFLWAWIAYSAIRLLQSTSFIGTESHILGYMSDELSYTFSTSVFAIVAALCLFGDLHNRRLCNGLHALPVRRETWLLTHLLAGLIFWLVPHLLQCALFMPLLGKDWSAALFWLLGTTVQYLFFLTLAVICTLCAGQKWSSVALYLLANWLPTLCQWFVTCVYQPVLVGIAIPEEPFYLFSPANFFASHQLLRVTYPDSAEILQYVYNGLGSGWWYLAVLGVGAVGLTALSVLAYRRRPLEPIGDLAVFRPVKAALWVLGSLMSGILLYAVVTLVGGSTVVVMIGITLSGMLSALILYRSKKRALRGLLKGAALAGVIGGSVLLVSLDPLGITKWKPAPEEVEYVLISDYFYANEEELQWYNYIRLTAPEDIEKLINTHELLTREGESSEALFSSDEYGSIYISYHLKDGTVKLRQYYYLIQSDAGRAVEPYWTSPEYLLGYEDWDHLLEQHITAHVELCINDQLYAEEYKTWSLDAAETQGLLLALKTDCENGVINTDDYSDLWISLDNGKSFYITPKCRSTTAWLREHIPEVYASK